MPTNTQKAAALLSAHPEADPFELLGNPVELGLASLTVSTPSGFNLDDYVGFSWSGKPVIDLDGVKAHIDSGTTLKAPNGVITYSFTDLSHLTGVYNNPNFGFTAGYGFSPFSAQQRTEARASIQLWDDLIPQKFVEKNGIGADIQFANSYDPAQAYAYYPGKQGYKFQSDVFVADPAVNWTNAWFGFGGYGKTTLVHELGHTLGLSHPGNYNYDPNLPLTYANYAEYAQDSTQYTIMSYWDAAETGANIIDWSTVFYGYAQTPLLHDILTIQSKYGADTTTRAGNTTYGFNSNAGNVVYDFSKNAYPYLSIYDAGGIDTLDLSGFTASQQIDLHAGSFSSVGQAAADVATVNANRAALNALAGGTVANPASQAGIDNVANRFMTANADNIFYDTGVSGVRATEYMNLSIAYGTTIENAIGGSARDVIWGNQVANVLKGLGGDDVLNGFEGKDTLYGGAGADLFQFHVVEKGDTIADFVSGTDRIDLRHLGSTVDGAGADLTWIGSAGFSGAAGELRFAGGHLMADLNGDKVADFDVTVSSTVLQSDVLFL
ncbi:M10 family metallopeptidase C-terminal domain-containing protein [Novosphingobium huizhouense]|uniref:M10 family metallopeptidase C-terminal domain-containing protein n=1 Tax=Novosphingobium huizhouense TaxID=2866625 RepID=UPI001CD864A8|nr:M10 family metallopeptidase C-terminal domain-containing protein [Novosphingobium huizhouense]